MIQKLPTTDLHYLEYNPELLLRPISFLEMNELEQYQKENTYRLASLTFVTFDYRSSMLLTTNNKIK